MKGNFTKLILALFSVSPLLSKPQNISFYKDITPILAMHCNSCHGKGDTWWPAEQPAGSLDTRSYRNLMAGGEKRPGSHTI